MPLKQAIYTDFVVSKGEKKTFLFIVHAFLSRINIIIKYKLVII